MRGGAEDLAGGDGNGKLFGQANSGSLLGGQGPDGWGVDPRHTPRSSSITSPKPAGVRGKAA